MSGPVGSCARTLTLGAKSNGQTTEPEYVGDAEQ